mgnify:CR=1 FL=1
MCVVVDSPGRTGRYRGSGRPAAAAAQIGAGGALFSGHAQAHYLCGNITSDVGAANGAVAEAMSDDDRQNGGRKGDGPATGVVVKAKPKTKKPSMYKVLMLNDDYTPMEFVVHVLEAFFHKNREEATRIMLHVHRRGLGVCGVYTYEVAETKVAQVVDFARRHEHPLQLTLEKE